MKVRRGKQILHVLLPLLMVMAVAIGEALAVPIQVHRSQADFMSGGGTQVIGCAGEGCTSGAFSIGNTSGTSEWEMVSRVFRDAAVPNTTFHYTLFNDAFTQPITSFHIANNGLIGLGTAPAGWVFTENTQFWTWSTTNPNVSGIGITQSQGGFDVAMSGSPAVTFNLASVNLADGTVISSPDFRGPGPGTPTGGLGGVLGAPEPASLMLLGSGLAGLRFLRRRS